MSKPRCNICEGSEKEDITDGFYTMTWPIPGIEHVDVWRRIRVCDPCRRKKAEYLHREDTPCASTREGD